jgi:hypothetical protein
MPHHTEHHEEAYKGDGTNDNYRDLGSSVTAARNPGS